MVFFVVGLPGRFAEWCSALTMGLVCRALGPSKLTNANSLAEIFVNVLGSGSAHGVVASRYPGERIRRALMDAGRPFIVSLDDPRVAIADLAIRGKVEIVEATRQVASSCASVGSFYAAPGALVLCAERDGGDRLLTAAAIARHLKLEICDGEIAEIVGNLGGGDDLLDSTEVLAWWEELDKTEQAIVSGALGPYLDHFADLGLGPITWAPELFFVGDRPDARATNGVDITGRARCLMRGPHIMLPPANWSLAVKLEISPETTEHSFLIEASAGAVVSQTVIRPTAAGVVEAGLTLALDDLADTPVDLFLSNERPAFGGHLTLLGVTLTPRPATPEDAPSETAPNVPETIPG
jgi:hypothetical protein